MLQHLSIRHIVLIRSCDIPFEDGLCVLTGETGAGKSILLDALGLALGARGETSLIAPGEQQGSVTAEFLLRNADRTREILSELGLEVEESLVIRRIVQQDGKSRCFVNDQPVSVTGLKRIGESLLEISGQHDQRGLLDVRSHMHLLDSYGKLDAPKMETATAYKSWRALTQNLEALRAQIAESLREREYLEHMAAELSALAPSPGEEEELSDRRATMMQSEKLSTLLDDAMQLLSGNQTEDHLRQAQRLLTRSPSSQQFEPAIDALERAQVELQEALAQLEAIKEKTRFNPYELERMEERLFALKAAARKYDRSVDELPGLLQDVSQKLTLLSHEQSEIAQLESRTEAARQAYLASAQQLSDARGHAAQRLQRALEKELAPLKMARCRFRVVQEELPQNHWSASGTDLVRFEAATNAGQHYAPMHKIASGGELSRFMLALKVVLSSVNETPCLIFDEIDTGTGGAVADAIGARLALLSDHAQILVVTHLPQVAARGNHHLLIEKSDNGTMSETKVRVLSVAERKEELARMLAGSEITDEARGAARRLMEAAG